MYYYYTVYIYCLLSQQRERSNFSDILTGSPSKPRQQQPQQVTKVTCTFTPYQNTHTPPALAPRVVGTARINYQLIVTTVVLETPAAAAAMS